VKENKLRIEIKSRFGGKVLFAHEQEENSMKITLEAAVKVKADLRYADLRYADLRYVILSSVDLSGADLCFADLYGAILRGTILRCAILRGATLRGVDLSGADLCNTILCSAILSGTVLCGTILRGADLETATYGDGVIIGNNPMFIDGLTWPVYIFKTHIKIGCQIHSKQEWFEFDDEAIAKMEPRALEFWNKWKKHILWMAFEESK
jgi:hypothetical protein